jgi:hypothetical protein
MENLDKVAILELFTRLDDKTLGKFCSSNSTYRKFCNTSSILWKNRLLKYLGRYYSKIDPNKNVSETVDYYQKFSNLNWRDYYITTMSVLDDVFINLHYNKSNREHILKLIQIMEKEPFYLYTRHLYENVLIDEKIYENLGQTRRNESHSFRQAGLDETDKRWVSPGVMLFHILIGNIKKEETIIEILKSDRLSFDDIDIIFNTLNRHYNYSLMGIKYIIHYYETMEPKLDGKNKVIVREALEDLKGQEKLLLE